MNKYLLVDSATSKKKHSDYTAMWVVGLAADGNYYALDMVRDRLNLAERGDRLFDLHRKWKPREVRYERYGLMADIEHYKQRMENENYRFPITEVAGQTSKADRIKRLLPIFEQKRFWLPKTFHVTDWQKYTVDLVHSFVEEEYMAFPVGLHEDSLDALSRIAEPDLRLVWPKAEKIEYVAQKRESTAPQTAWMA
jgi:predicted phage terminase large subunit-like protein